MYTSVLEWEAIEPYVLYSINTDVKSELNVAKNYLSAADLESDSAVFTVLETLPAAFFSHLTQLLKILFQCHLHHVKG